MRMRCDRVAASLVLSTMACARAPERVFVPGAPFRHVVTISTEQGDHATVSVGQPLTLHATRESGPWVEQAGSERPADGCWAGAVEPREAEVAAMLTWEVEPGGLATFDVGRLETIEKRTREVRFSKAGEYQLSATSALICSRQVSNTIRVTVRD
jgi:hypothetical protein